MSSETKAITAIIVITLLVIIGGVFVMSSQSSNLPSVVVKQDILVRPDSPTKMSAENKVTIVEFADYECPSCAALHPALKQLLADPKYGKLVTLVYRNLPIHGGSVPASVAVQAAGAQGKYWEMNDIMFEKQDEWAAIPATDQAKRDVLFAQYAATIGLDVPKWQADQKDPKYTELVKRDQADAVTMDINATPTMIIDGSVVVQGAISYEKLLTYIDAELAKTTTATTTVN